MGILVNAAEAGLLVGRHERIVRGHIHEGHLPARKDDRGRWQINTDDLTRVRGWVVDRERLAQFESRASRSYGGLVARVEALEARLRANEALLQQIERGIRDLRDLRERRPPPTQPTEPPDDLPPAAIALPDELVEPYYPARYRGPATVTLEDRGPDLPRTFRTHADAARWLERHGVSAETVKNWPGWRRVDLTPDAALTFALARQREAQARGDWRVKWRLRRCDDAVCVCQVTLEG